ncbi:MAG TPA: hypothetical protein VHI93_00065, partial [Candidatus Thermoplasmatota archaeon]|nr:hypothetical protein [Candidatus Thermoplasmatota archaeon]
MSMRPALALLVCTAVLAGCLAAPAPCPQLPAAAVLHVPEALPLGTDPRQAADALYLVQGLDPALSPRVAAGATDGTGASFRDGKPVEAERTSFPSNVAGQRLERLRFAPSILADGVDVSWRIAYDAPARCDSGAGGLVHGLGGGAQREGQLVHPGQGAHVWYAGFWENGTMFGTNIEAFDQSAWPRASWYESEPYEPLPVYVYDQSPRE